MGVATATASGEKGPGIQIKIWERELGMSATHGGARKGAGRKPGALNVRTREIAEKSLKEGITPLEFLLREMREEPAPRGKDEGDFEYGMRLAKTKEYRKDCAVSAAPYVHPKLAAIEMKVEGEVLHEIALAELE